MTRGRIRGWLWRLLAAAVLGHAATAEAEGAPGEAAAPSATQLAQDGYAAFEAGDMKAAARQFLGAIEAGGLAPEQARSVTLGLSDALMAMGRAREAAQALDLLRGDTGFDILSRRAFALDGAGDRPGAAVAYAAAAEAAASPEQRTMMLKGVVFAKLATGDKAATLAGLARLQDDPNLSLTDAVNFAYAALKFEDDARALAFFAQADRRKRLDGSAALDAGYSAKRMGDEAAAVRYFRQGLESAVLGRPLEGRNLIRREVADLSRRGGVNASLIYDGGDTLTARLPGAGPGVATGGRRSLPAAAGLERRSPCGALRQGFPDTGRAEARRGRRQDPARLDRREGQATGVPEPGLGGEPPREAGVDCPQRLDGARQLFRHQRNEYCGRVSCANVPCVRRCGATDRVETDVRVRGRARRPQFPVRRRTPDRRAVRGRSRLL